jgi:hypothetical protein
MPSTARSFDAMVDYLRKQEQRLLALDDFEKEANMDITTFKANWEKAKARHAAEAAQLAGAQASLATATAANATMQSQLDAVSGIASEVAQYANPDAATHPAAVPPPPTTPAAKASRPSLYSMLPDPAQFVAGA